MSSITSFVSELVRAANEVDRLNAFTISRLLERAIATIQDLRHAANAVSELGASDHASALLDAADMIRTLHIVLESGVEIQLRPSDGRMDR